MATIIAPKSKPAPLKPEQKKKIFNKDHKMVTGTFRSLESPGGNLKFIFRKYKEDSPVVYEFEDGKSYDLPWMVVDHINNGCSYPVHAHTLDAEGKAHKSVGRTVRRFSFDMLSYFESVE